MEARGTGRGGGRRRPMPSPFFVQANVDAAVARLATAGATVAGIAAHVGDEADVKRLIDFTVSTFGKIDVLVSNAAVNPFAGEILDHPDSALTKIFDVNVLAAIRLVRAAAPFFAPAASVVFISSITAYRPESPIAVYAVSKTALVALSRALAEELAPSGVRVNAVAPGTVPTKFAAALVESDEMRRESVERTLLKRLGTPADVAGAVAFLASDDAAYVTGECICVSGGMLTARL